MPTMQLTSGSFTRQAYLRRARVQGVRAIGSNLRALVCRATAAASSSSSQQHTPTLHASQELVLSVKGLSARLQQVEPEQRQRALEAIKHALEEVPGVAEARVEADGRCMVVASDRHSVQLKSLTDAIRGAQRGLRPLPYAEHRWVWQGHDVVFGEAGPREGPAVLCLHGFGASGAHYRKLVEGLAGEYHVFVLDLLGFGGSSKPGTVSYNPHLWQRQVSDFVQQVVGQPTVLVGNSIGSQVATYVAAEHPEQVSGLVLLNATGAMNFRGLYQDDWRLALCAPVFPILAAAMKLDPVAEWAFGSYAKRDRVSQLLADPRFPLYANPEAVDDELIDMLLEPAEEPGARGVFVQVFTGDPGPRPEACMKKVQCPTQVQWGDRDAWTKVDGVLPKYFQDLAAQQPDKVEFHVLPDVGHCPQDDRPELVLEHIRPFLRRVTTSAAAAAA